MVQGTADAEIEVPSVENQELTNELKLGVCQNIAKRASPAARNFFLALIHKFPVHSSSFFFFVFLFSLYKFVNTLPTFRLR